MANALTPAVKIAQYQSIKLLRSWLATRNRKEHPYQQLSKDEQLLIAFRKQLLIDRVNKKILTFNELRLAYYTIQASGLLALKIDPVMEALQCLSGLAENENMPRNQREVAQWCLRRFLDALVPDIKAPASDKLTVEAFKKRAAILEKYERIHSNVKRIRRNTRGEMSMFLLDLQEAYSDIPRRLLEKWLLKKPADLAYHIVGHYFHYAPETIKTLCKQARKERHLYTENSDA